MPSPTTTFRFADRERRRLDQLAHEMVCSRADVLRLGLAALQRDPALREEVRALNVARAFIKSLRTQYGDNAILELDDGRDDKWKLAGEPIDAAALDLDVKRVGDRFVMSLLDPESRVEITNVRADSWTDEDGVRHAVVPLSNLWASSASELVAEPRTRQLCDGRTVVQIPEDDGTVRHVVLDNDGNARILEPNELPVAAFR
ncbi:MAG TPA: hypothetical protein VIJ51_00500 [Solirubrobacteraceae bacterium]|jgi:hypothetical protein